MLDLEDAVSEKVAKLLIPKLTGEEEERLARRNTDSPDAFKSYLRGRFLLYSFTAAEFARAQAFFEEAIRIDPEYALAYLGLAEYYFIHGTFAGTAPIVSFAETRRLAKHALSIDGSLGEAHAFLGFSYFGDFDFEEVEKHLRHSIELNPNYPFARMWRSVLYIYYGRYEEAIAEARYAAELNPVSTFEHNHYTWILYQARRFDDSVAEKRKLVAADPNFSHGLASFSWVLRYLGQSTEAIYYARRAVELSDANQWFLSNLAACYAKDGEAEKAREILLELEKMRFEKYVSPYCLAIVHLNLGDKARALDELTTALETKDVRMHWIVSEPELDPLRSEERFADLIRQIKNPQ